MESWKGGKGGGGGQRRNGKKKKEETRRNLGLRESGSRRSGLVPAFPLSTLVWCLGPEFLISRFGNAQSLNVESGKGGKGGGGGQRRNGKKKKEGNSEYARMPPRIHDDDQAPEKWPPIQQCRRHKGSSLPAFHIGLAGLGPEFLISRFGSAQSLNVESGKAGKGRPRKKKRQKEERGNAEESGTQGLSRVHSAKVRFAYENEATERWGALSPTRLRAFALTLSALRSMRSTATESLRLRKKAQRFVFQPSRFPHWFGA